MSNLRQAAEQALVVMGINQYTVAELAPHKVVMQFNDAMSALTAALRAALAEPEQEQEPVLLECVTCGTVYADGVPPAPTAEDIAQDWDLLKATQESLREHMAEIQRLRAALAEPEQEPCGYDETTGLCTRNPCCYTAPLQRKPLTKQEIWKIHDLCIPPTEGYVSPVEFARAIEAAHGIKGEA